MISPDNNDNYINFVHNPQPQFTSFNHEDDPSRQKEEEEWRMAGN